MSRTVQIAPSILSADFADLGKDVRLVAEAGADWIHVDVMDGHFVPNLTIGPAHVKALKRVTDVPLDVHLMIDNPDAQLDWYIDAGADSITIHIEACDDPVLLMERMKEAGVKAGISLNPETGLEAIEGVLAYADLVLVMSVHPGFGGQSYIEGSTSKIAVLKDMLASKGCNAVIEVDGGITLQTAPIAAAAGADILVAGSAVFGAEDPACALKEIRDACE